MHLELEAYLQTIRKHLIHTHSRVLHWFEVDQVLKNYRPLDGGWTIAEILEHIALTSHFLLILIDKGAAKALKNVQDRSLESLLEEFDDDLQRIDNE